MPQTMQQPATSFAATQRIQFPWILDRQRDLFFYIGSAIAGWLYVAIIFFAMQRLSDPLHEAFGIFKLGFVEVSLSLELLVVASWALILDAPHVWATLGRTLLDPDEWRVRGREIRISFLWFLLGPLAILLPYALGAAARAQGFEVEPGMLALGAVVFFVFFRLWAYYHVVRQHWGFFTLYRRKGGEHREESFRIDYWFFNLSLYLPLLLFMTSAFYQNTPGFPALGLHQPIWEQLSIASILHPLAWWSYLAVIILYAGYQLHLYRQGHALNGSKLLYMALIVPLHFVAFSNPVMAVFVVPLVTVGHNIQYHCIVYSFGQNKYRQNPNRGYRWARALFRNFGSYALTGLLFTFIFYRGPWIDWLKSITGLQLDDVLLNSLGMMAGIKDPASLGLGEQIFAAGLLGFAMQHYYLDSKIWRVSKDKDVQKNLNL